MEANQCPRLCVGGFGVAAGVVWGGGLFLLGVLNILTDWGSQWVTFLSHGYVGYEATFLGALIGGLWGFFDALIAGLIFALVYNGVAKCCAKCCKVCCKGKSCKSTEQTTSMD